LDAAEPTASLVYGIEKANAETTLHCLAVQIAAKAEQEREHSNWCFELDTAHQILGFDSP
jgi:hypothetical protein